MLQAIWQSFKNFPNHILASPHVMSAQLLGFSLIISIQLPFLWLHVSKLRFLFMAKTVAMPLTALTLFVWTLVAGKIITIVHFTKTSNTLVATGFDPTFNNDTHITDDTPAILVFFQCVTTAIGSSAALTLNMPDFTGYAKHPKQVF
jgi:nucleobase:cation symporter-1, NCS1 family